MDRVTVLEIWAGLGPLVGVITSQMMSRGFQQEQWFRDSKRKEYRELIMAVTRAIKLVGETTDKSSESHLVEMRATVSYAFEIYATRLFIYREITTLMGEWKNSMDDFAATKDAKALGIHLGHTAIAIRETAQRDFKNKSWWQKLWKKLVPSSPA